MKILIQFIILLVLMVSCQSENSSTSISTLEESQNNTIVNNSHRNSIQSNSKEEKSNKGKDISPTTIIPKNKPLVTKEEIEKKKKDVIERSPNKEKSCADILKEYQQVIDNFLESKNEADLLPLDEWDNDPFFNDCRKKDEFKDLFNEWEEKLNKI